MRASKCDPDSHNEVADYLIDLLIEAEFNGFEFPTTLGVLTDGALDFEEDGEVALMVVAAFGFTNGWDADENFQIPRSLVIEWLAYYGRKEANARRKEAQEVAAKWGKQVTGRSSTSLYRIFSGKADLYRFLSEVVDEIEVAGAALV